MEEVTSIDPRDPAGFDSGIQEMGIENTGFLVEKLASDCGEKQYLRELVVNSMEAIECRRSGGWSGEGEIRVGVDWKIFKETGFYKLCIADNGSGMSASEICRYINNLSASARAQGLDKNYGLGAKITAAVKSPEGLMYKSWQGGSGVVAIMHKSEDSGKYGLLQIPVGEDLYQVTPPLKTEEERPNPIESGDAGFGTSVTLMGESGGDCTFLPQGESTKWVIKYLNDRFFALPENLSMQVETFLKTDPEDWPEDESFGASGQNRSVRGMKHRLDGKSESRGVVEMSVGSVHWWIFPEEGVNEKDIWESRGHVASLFQNELYDFSRLRKSQTILRQFGVIYGGDRVVIYVEPSVDRFRVHANISRESIRVDGEPLDWEAWASEFRLSMPQEIKDMMDGIYRQNKSDTFDDAIEDWYKRNKDLLVISRYRYRKTGSLKSVGHSPGGGESGSGRERIGTGKRKGGQRGGRTAANYGLLLDAAGAESERIKSASHLPKVVWVSVGNKTRSEGGELEDKAALYHQSEHLIHMNSDFRVIKDLVQKAFEKGNYDQDPSVVGKVTEVVKGEVSIQVVETVMGVLTLAGSKEWDESAIAKALTTEALSAAVMQRSNILKTVSRRLSAVLGKKSSDKES